jgi:hypothetical protein
MGLQAADVEVHLLGQPESMTADVDEIAGRHERLDVTLERRALVARDFEDLKEFAHAGRVMHPLPHQCEYRIA